MARENHHDGPCGMLAGHGAGSTCGMGRVHVRSRAGARSTAETWTRGSLNLEETIACSARDASESYRLVRSPAITFESEWLSLKSGFGASGQDQPRRAPRS